MVKSRDDAVDAVVVVVYYRHLPPAFVVLNAVLWRGNEDIQTETSTATRDERCDTENQMQLWNLSR